MVLVIIKGSAVLQLMAGDVDWLPALLLYNRLSMPDNLLAKRENWRLDSRQNLLKESL